MNADPRTVVELEQAGFTHLRLTCPTCPRVVMYPFNLIRARHPFMTIDAMTAVELGARFRCEHCPGRRRRRSSRGRRLRPGRGAAPAVRIPGMRDATTIDVLLQWHRRTSS
jgi:hypothetical protein